MAQEASTNMAISVVVCHHAGRLIDRCLTSIATSQGIRVDVIVLSSDATWKPLNGFVGRVYGEQGGPAHKRNVGVAKATEEIVAFLDDDAEVGPFTLYQLWMAICSNGLDVGMVFGKLLNMERRQELDDAGSWLTATGFLYARADSQTDTGQYDREAFCLASKSALCAVTKRAFYRVGGFDPDYFILGEETDLAWRMWLRGHYVLYHPFAVGWHAFNSSLKPTDTYYTIQRIHTFGARNYVSLLVTNLGSMRLVRTLPIHIGAWLLAALGFAAKGQAWRARAILVGLIEAARRLPKTLAKRRTVQSQRIRSDRELAPFIMARPPVSYYARRIRRYWEQMLHG